MRYLGGKSRIAKPISDIINTVSENMDFGSNEKTFLSLFCGSCAVETKIKGFDKVILNDIHEYLITLWKGLQNGYIPPDVISEEEYKYVRENKDKDRCLSGFVGFCCSFCGKWFNGYARGAGRNFALEGRNSLLRDIKNLQNAEFICKDYRNVTPPSLSKCDICRPTI